MSVREKIQEDFQMALKEKKEREVSILRMLMAALLNKEKEKRATLAKNQSSLSEKELLENSKLDDTEVSAVIYSEIKKRKEAIAGFEKGKREDLVKKEREEIEVLQRYLPRQLTIKEIEDLCRQVIEEVGAGGLKDMGKVMQVMMPKVKGRADGKQVSEIVKRLLSLD